MTAQHLVHEAERRGRVQIAALRNMLVKTGIATHEEIEDAVREIEAGIAVEDALNPELQAALEEMRKIMEQLERDQGGERK